MIKQRLYHSNFNHMGWRKKKGEKSRAHNLRSTLALKKLYMQSVELNEICDPDLIKNNLLFIPDESGILQKVSPMNGDEHFNAITQQLDDERKEYIGKLDNAFTDSNKAELSDKRAKAKAALKRYTKSSEDFERDFWNNLTQRLGTESVDSEDEIAKLKVTTNGKIKRFNQKVKRIKELSQYNGLIGVKSRNTEYTIFSKEVVYKIPDDTDLNIKPIDMANFVNKMNKRLYPDFQPTYITIHADENAERAHAHCEFSGKNLKTDEMDIQQQLFFNLEREFKRQKQSFPFAGRTYNDLGFDEVKRFGEVYQDYIFEEMNLYLNKKGYKANLEKRTEQEKKNDQEKFFDSHKPTQKREYTRAKKLQKENKIIEDKNEVANSKLDNVNNKLNRKSEIIEVQDLVISEKKIKINGLNSEIGKKEKFLIQLNETIKDALINAYEYAVKDLPVYIHNYFHKQEQLEEISKEVAREVKNKSVEMQPTEDKKNKIRKGKYRLS